MRNQDWKNVRMIRGSIIVSNPELLAVNDARVIGRTVDDALQGTFNCDIRSDVDMLGRRVLELPGDQLLSESTRELVMDIVKRFNELGENRSSSHHRDSDDEVRSVKSKSDDDPSDSDVMPKWAEKLVATYNGQSAKPAADARVDDIESELKKTSATLEEVTTHLGYSKVDGKVTFTNVFGTFYNFRTAAWTALITVAILWIVLGLGVGMTFPSNLLIAAIFGLILGGIVGALTAQEPHRDNNS